MYKSPRKVNNVYKSEKPACQNMIVLVISNAWGSARFRPNCSHVISEKVAKLYAFYPCVKKKKWSVFKIGAGRFRSPTGERLRKRFTTIQPLPASIVLCLISVWWQCLTTPNIKKLFGWILMESSARTYGAMMEFRFLSNFFQVIVGSSLDSSLLIQNHRCFREKKQYSWHVRHL